MTNAIVEENLLRTSTAEWQSLGMSAGGEPRDVWDAEATNQIEGFSTDISVNHGDRIDFKINVNAAIGVDVPYHIEIYRLGYYGGDGARLVHTSGPLVGEAQPEAIFDPATGLVDAGNWGVSTGWDVPADATSGVYLVKLVRDDNGATNQIPFIVRNDESPSDIVLQTSDTTWHAYNGWAGNNGVIGGNFYGDPSGTISHDPVADPGVGAQNRAYAVSYNRPFITRDGGGAAAGAQDYLFGADYAAIYWLEENGYDVSYISGVDTDRLGADALLDHKAFISVGHDEYWSGEQRYNVEAARDAGVNLLFWSGNEVYWKTRYESSTVTTDGSPTDYRTLVSYKETWANRDPNAGPEDYANIDPSNIWTGTWRDMRFVDAVDENGNYIAGGSRLGAEPISGSLANCSCVTGAGPETTLTGQLFRPDGTGEFGGALDVPIAFANLRVWRDTSVAATGQLNIAEGILGYEWNVSPSDEFRPAGLVKLSETNIPWSSIVVDQGNLGVSGSATHNLSLYRAESGALVFGAGTTFWTWALSDEHDSSPYGANIENLAIQQFTVNMFADMGIQPGVADAILASQGLVRAVMSTDGAAATTTIQLPDTVERLQTVTITGTATDNDGNPLTTDGVVAVVEVSVDGGATWRVAQGTTNWTYTWYPTTQGTHTILARAIDDSLNVFNATPAQKVVTVTPGLSSMFDLSTPANAAQHNDGATIELGMRFTASEDGQITQLKYYRGDIDSAIDSDVREGHLWGPNGTLLATVTFTSTPGQSGWQVVNLSTPVAILAGLEYVVSYRTQNYYVSTTNFFTPGNEVAFDGIDNNVFSDSTGLLNAPESGAGVFKYGTALVMPDETFNNENYWVDVTFDPSQAPNQAPTITSSAAYTIDENSITVGTVTATDPEGNAITYAIAGGVDAARFAINATTGALSFVTAPNYELPGDSDGNNVYEVVVRASDGRASTTQTVAVTVADVVNEPPNQAPTITSSASFTANESQTTAGTITATDPEGSAITYAIAGGADAALFTINATTGVLSFLTAPNYDAPVDTGGDNVYDVIVSASDGEATTTQAVAVTVADVAGVSLFNDAPTNATQYNDNAQVELGMRFTADQNGQITQLKYYRSAADANDTDVRQGHLWGPDGTLLATATFTSASGQSGWQVATLSAPVSITAGLEYVVSYRTQNNYVSSGNFFTPANEVAFDGVDDDAFSNASGTLSAPQSAAGVFKYGTALVFPNETYNNSNYWVDVTFSPIAPNQAPAISSSASFTVNENQTTAGTVTATDPEGSAITYAIAGGVDAARFTINATTGALSFVSAPNFEAPNDTGGNNVYDIIVSASDGQLTTTQNVAVTVANVAEAPTITSSASFTVNENQTTAGTVTATDPEGSAITYAIDGGADAALFTINATTGALSFVAAPDYEAPTDANGDNVYNVTVSASDGQATTTQTVAVTVANVVEQGPNQAPTITSSASFTASENQTTAGTVTATDPEGSAITYAIAGGVDAARFTINATTGALSFVAAPDYEAPVDAGGNNVYDVTVSASDDQATTTQNVAVTVANVAEAPTITSSASFTVNENQTTAGTVTATDPEGSAITYAIAGGVDAARFTINATTGALSFVAAPDYEAPVDAGGNNVYDIIVSASDGQLTTTQNVAVTVANVAEAPTITSSASFTVNENQTTAGTVTATDPEGSAITYAIAGGADAARFTVNATTGALSFVAAPDYEAPTDTNGDNVYDVTVSASDGQATTTQNVAVTVADVAESPPGTISLFGSAAATNATQHNDGTALELGMRFTTDQDGQITQLKYYRGTADANDTDARQGHLWGPNGTLLATVTFNSTAGQSGWQIATLSAPVAIIAGLEYVVSYRTQNNYVSTGNFFTPANEVAFDGVDDDAFSDASGILSAPQSAAGVYKYGTAVVMPDEAFNGANYWVDVTFNPGSEGGSNQAPTITSSASFTVDENQSTVGTVTATDPEGSTLAYAISGGSDAARFTINATTGVLSFVTAPDFEAPADADGDNVYSVTVRASDGQANTTQTIAVTVADVAEAPQSTVSLFGSATATNATQYNDGTSVELGMRFTADQDGEITQLKYYRGTADASDTDTRQGHLWGQDGSLLATVTFDSAPGASGWQVATLSAPVAITAGLEYVVSYRTQNNYVSTASFFTPANEVAFDGVDDNAFSDASGLLSAPESGAGVYKYGAALVMPDETFNGANYWVDVTFDPANWPLA